MHDKVKPKLFLPTKDDIEAFDNARLNGELTQCPCCDKIFNEIYKRRIYKSMVDSLIEKNKSDRYFSPTTMTDFTKLRHWGLIEKTNDEEKWIVTQKGKDFIDNKIKIPNYAIIQNNRVIGFSKTKIYINEIIKGGIKN